jgi:hypothetical protein
LSLPARHRGVDRVGQEHVKQHQYYKRNPGFIVIQVQAHYHFRTDWYRQGEVCALAKQYYVVLRSVLRSRPDLRRCLSRCRHCGVFFLTHPRNAGRSDLGCPFGCREAHRKQRSTKRSVAYYATTEGQVKKKMQNGKRVQGGVTACPAGDPAPGWPDGKPQVDATPPVAEAEAPQFPAGVVSYVAMVASLIEGRPVSKEEIVRVLLRAMRQHSMARRRRIDYVVAQLNQRGP